MAKKSTTGGPRSRRVTEADLQRRREYMSRAERDRMWQRRFTIAALILLAVSVVLLAAGVLNDQVIRPNQAITAVNGDEIDTKDFQSRVRFLRWQTAEQIRELFVLTGGDTNTIQQYAGQQINQLQSPALFGGQVLDEMEEELLLAQAAEERGIVVDEATVDREVDEFMAQTVGVVLPEQETSTPTVAPSVTPTPLVSATPSSTPALTSTATPVPASTEAATDEPAADATAEATAEAESTPSATPTEFMSPTPSATLEAGQLQGTLDNAASDYFGDAQEGADVNREVVREVFYFQALRSAVLEDVTKDVPREELQVHPRHMLFAFNPENPQDPTPPTEEQKAAALARAEAAMEALQNGEPFADLAVALSDDTGSAPDGGDIGWSNPDALDAAFADTALNASLGEIAGPVESQFGYHIIQVLGREVRELTPSEYSSRRQETFTEWLDAQRAAATVDRRDDWIDRVPDEPTYSRLLGDILPLQ